MRVFYIFKISEEFKNLTRKNSFNLYKSIENIYNLNTKDYEIGVTMFETLAEKIDKKNVNLNIFNRNKDNDHYTKYKNIHMINNYFNDEKTKLVVNNSHLLIKSTKQFPLFLRELKFDKNLFVCDFTNKDYFWVDELLEIPC